MLGGKFDAFSMGGKKVDVRTDAALLRRIVVSCSALVKCESERRKAVNRD